MSGETHVLVGKSKIVAHLQQDDAGDRIELGGKTVLSCKPRDLTHRDVDCAIDLPRLDCGHPRRGILDDLDGDTGNLGYRSPIIDVPLEDDAGIELVFNELIEPGAEGHAEEGVKDCGLDPTLGNEVAA